MTISAALGVVSAGTLVLAMSVFGPARTVEDWGQPSPPSREGRAFSLGAREAFPRRSRLTPPWRPWRIRTKSANRNLPPN
jgi:hypothetical protein